MPRYPRNCLKTNIFHVMTQGINKSYIFQEEIDIKFYINQIFILQKKTNVKIEAYCIMNNHAHLLIEVKDIKDLSKFMQRLNTKYGIYYNKKYNRVGYVFRDRFRSEGIYSEEQKNKCRKYIFNNPVKAGICKEAKEYPYSNCKEECKLTNEKFIDIEIDNEQDIIKFVEDYINNINFKELKCYTKEIKEMIDILKEKYDLSLRKIAEITGIGRETIRKIYNKELVKKQRPH